MDRKGVLKTEKEKTGQNERIGHERTAQEWTTERKARQEERKGHGCPIEKNGKGKQKRQIIIE
jgi:hypothetical protein